MKLAIITKAYVNNGGEGNYFNNIFVFCHCVCQLFEDFLGGGRNAQRAAYDEISQAKAYINLINLKPQILGSTARLLYTISKLLKKAQGAKSSRVCSMNKITFF